MNTQLKDDWIDCAHCAGKGRVILTGVYADTLVLLRKQKRKLNGAQLAKIARIEPTAMNNRLVALEGYGLATATRYGKERRWKAA